MDDSSLLGVAKRFRQACFGILLAVLVVSYMVGFGTGLAADWPRFRGPHNNGVSEEADWNANWAVGGPPILWRSDIGTGYSSVVVAHGRLYTLGNEENVDTVYCLNA
ncbi:MAG: hypothetical protein L7W43_06735, partial [Rubripirellula sp.]|nr:hypothetical protein [Rubripirellula sp.]